MTEKKATPPGKITLKNVRLAFPSLWEMTTVNGQGEPAYRAAFLFPKNHPQVKELNAIIEKLAKAKWEDKAAGILKTARATSKGGIQDGDTKENLDGYAGNYFVNANSSKNRPDVRDRDKSVLAKGDNKPQAGDYVNAVIEFWVQDNNYGKRINASLLGVQYVKEGPKFSAGSVSTDDDYEDLGDTGEDDDINDVA